MGLTSNFFLAVFAVVLYSPNINVASYMHFTNNDGDRGHIMRNSNKPTNSVNYDKKLVAVNAPKKPKGVKDMAFVKGGCFDMGDTFGDATRKLDQDEHVHRVCVDDYYIDKYEVTQKQFESVMGSNPSRFKGCGNCPVEQVTWFEARDYCVKLSKSLPTEAEWEYAAREGGKKVRFGTGKAA